jgi:hypothetical protein
MTHDHTHKLDFACMDCVKQRVRERDKLLAFVRQIANTKYNPHDPVEISNYCYHIDEAESLLKELGFEND